MKTILTAALLLAATGVRASLYTETWSGLSTTITDGSALPGSLSMTVTDTGGGTVAGLSVSLNFTGGYNGDLYVYLLGPNGTTAVTLLNRPGSAPFYAAGAGFGNGSANSFLLDSGNGNPSIQTAAETSGAVVLGNYSAAGNLANFNGLSADGTWTLYFADLSSGGGAGPSVVNGWSLNINAVPEPVNVALGFFGGLLALVATVRIILRQHKPAGIKQAA